MDSSEINIEADFLTFQNQIIDKFGEHYTEQVDLFFNRAVDQVKKGLINSALAYGRFAIEQSNFSNDKTGLSSLFGFMSQLYCDAGKIKKAKAYYELGLKMLDEEKSEYEDDKEMYRRLKEHIDSESWKEGLE